MTLVEETEVEVGVGGGGGSNLLVAAVVVETGGGGGGGSNCEVSPAQVEKAASALCPL